MIKTGIVGCGDIAVQHHIPAFKQNNNTDIKSACDVSEDRLESVKNSFDISNTYTDYTEMIKDTSLDVISICTPPDTHQDIVSVAANKGTNIICEKPTALTISDAEQIIESVDENDIMSGGGYALQFSPTFNRAMSQINSNIIGRLKKIQINYYLKIDWSKEWLLNPKLAGGGVTLNLFPHILSFLLRVFPDYLEPGDLTLINSSVNRYAAENIESDISFSFSMNETIINVSLGHRPNGGPREFHFFGSDGELHVNQQYTRLIKSSKNIKYSKTGLPSIQIPPSRYNLNGADPLVYFPPFRDHGRGINRVHSFIEAMTNDIDYLAPVDDCLFILNMVRSIYTDVGITVPITKR
jgi:predicted dehydrogenase